MDAKLVNPIIDAFMEVMPQMGFPMPRRQRIYLQDRNVISKGVALTVGFTKQMHGKVVYNMTADTARYIASTMMLGVPVTRFNELAQSALREMSNMLTARAATNFTKLGLDVDITTPELVIDEDHTIKVSDSHFLTVEMEIGGQRLDIALAVDREA
ncbi:MAG: chemotaxis protein CheX [Selenomonadaceae bacterium]|nr:chemotaxis protein CheX [Selenomonadaceae bacterium]MBR3497442.1 chemotaxis protein CheX [Selenomonadaceae bacterium]